MRVYVWPERTHEELGAERWDVEWYELRPEKRGVDTSEENEDFDYDRDLLVRHLSFPTVDAARVAARRIVDEGKAFFGAASVQRQIVDWHVEEDRIAEWTYAGEPEEIS